MPSEATTLTSGRNSSHALRKPTTAAAPHLSRDMPAIAPPALMSHPPVSYVTPWCVRKSNEIFLSDRNLETCIHRRYTRTLPTSMTVRS